MTSTRRDALSARNVVPTVVAVLQALVILGPALGGGVAITHDMAWSPSPRWTPFVLGLDTPAPRAVPSDAFAVLVGKVVGASVAQHLILLAILVGLGLGVVALLAELLPAAGVLARCVAAIAAVWNPFVSERLAVGQWTVLLGLAVVPWALRAAVRVVAGKPSAYAVLLAIVCAAVGGVNSVLVVSASALLALVAGAVRERSARVGRAAALTLAVTAGASAAWALPALTAPPQTSGEGVRAFAPVADSPLGVFGSLLSGGGFWNAGSHPEPRAHALIALTAALLAMAGVAAAVARSPKQVRWCLVLPLLVLSGLVLLSAFDGLAPIWDGLVTGLPGGGALRDSHKFLSVWVVLAAVGLGVIAHEARSRAHEGLLIPVAGLLLGLPVVLSPQLAWGLNGRLDAVTVPSDYLSGMDAVSTLPEGEVGLLPWSQYRRYDWNADRVSLTLAPRVIDRVVLYDDSLPLRAGTVPGESPRAAGVSRRIAEGEPAEKALAASGVRYLAAELGTAQDVDVPALRAMGRVVVDGPKMLVVEVGPPPNADKGHPALVLGWIVTMLTALCVGGWRGVAQVTRKLPIGLLPSRS